MLPTVGGGDHLTSTTGMLTVCLLVMIKRNVNCPEDHKSDITYIIG